ncbi:unnamed protein product, partial [Hapterophycus canaliculatus]
RYEGDFLRGQIHGRGRYMWSDGGIYEARKTTGDYMATSRGVGHDVRFPLPNGLRHGRGKRVWANGATYDGRQAWESDRMEGKGVHVCAEGSRYEGHFRANYRHGRGRCQWGNRHDTPFRQSSRPIMCPLGYTHAGRGYCVYEGGWKLGYWEGEGKFLCVDDRAAEGTWKRGKMDGWGASVLMLAHELGDPRRMYIGGVGGLYRVFKYSGLWSEGVRQGLGVAEYANEDRVIGNFVGTQLHGYGVYSFKAAGTARAAFWRMGTRERWVDEEEAKDNGPLVGAILTTLSASPGALLSGELHQLKELWRVCYAADDNARITLANNHNKWAEISVLHR